RVPRALSHHPQVRGRHGPGYRLEGREARGRRGARKGDRGRPVKALASLGLVAYAALVGVGCLYTRYVSQAAHGQFDLLGRSKPPSEVTTDPETPLRTAMLLAEIPAIKEYGRSYGLAIRKNYERYSALDRRAAVWFTAA